MNILKQNKKAKVLLINPPLFSFGTIYAAIPLLAGQLRYNNIETDIIDMNIECIKEITNPRFLKYIYNLLKKIYKNNKILNKNVDPKYHISDDGIQLITKLAETILSKHKNIFDTFMKNKKSLFETYMEIAYSDKEAENKEVLKKYNQLIKSIISMSFLPYFPEKCDLIFNKKGQMNNIISYNPLYKLIYEDIIDKSSNKKRNIYIKIFEAKVKELKLNKYDIIAITIPFEQNIYPALTLSKILKEKTKAKIIIGGIQASASIDAFIKHSDMFGTFFDNLLLGEGEKSLIDYVRYIENKLPVTSVSGLVYKENNIIKRNDIIKIENINDILPPSYDGVDFNSYSSKYIPLEFSKGCYWHKCSFCYNNKLKNYYIRNPIDAVNIIESLQKKYKINHFCIHDDALSINFAEKFAAEIIKRNMNITYSCFFRMEENLTKDKLEIFKQSGLVDCYFGVESGSKRILKLMNKGINIQTAKRIIKDCFKIGIDVSIGLMYGFPTETEEDVMKTIEFKKEVDAYITKASNIKFTLLKSSAILSMKEELQITDIEQPEEFSELIKYKAPEISNERLCEIMKENHIDLLQELMKG